MLPFSWQRIFIFWPDACPSGKWPWKVTCPSSKSTCPRRPDGFFFEAYIYWHHQRQIQTVVRTEFEPRATTFKSHAQTTELHCLPCKLTLKDLVSWLFQWPDSVFDLFQSLSVSLVGPPQMQADFLHKRHWNIVNRKILYYISSMTGQ